MDLVWEMPPQDALTATRRGPYTDVIRALKENPGQWARIPRDFKSEDSAKNAATNMRRGIGSFAPRGSFEAVSKGAVVWARIVGGEDGDNPERDGDDDAEDNGSASAKGAGSSRTAPDTDPELSQRVRAWAKEQGYEVAERGRMSRDVFDAYFIQHPTEKRPKHLHAVTGS
jgi:hypothetical protein